MKINHTLNKYLLSFEDTVKNEIFHEPGIYGIRFFVDGKVYELLHNEFLGDRLLINGNVGEVKDLPFYNKTFAFLPACVEVSVLDINWEARAKELWALLDDIDSADDSCKNNDALFRTIARGKVHKRFKILDSDGYNLLEPKRNM